MGESGPCDQSRNMSSIMLSQRLGIEEILLRVIHELNRFGLGGGHMGAHGRAFDLEAMIGVEGEVVCLI